MAAIYSGIHLKLKSHRTSWPDKLKLARFAWISPQCVLPNKEQLLFDWASHALTGYYSKKVELPQEVVAGLWAYLDDILHSKNLLNALSKGRSLSLRLAVAQVINERVLECASGTCLVGTSTVLSCCQGVLSSPVLSATYSAKYELLVELVSRLCALACSELSPGNVGQPLVRQVFEVFQQTLCSYLMVQRHQTNPNRVFTQVTAHLLQPFLLLRHLLAVRVWRGDDDAQIQHHLSREIRSQVDAVLQSALFALDHLPSYREELLPEKEVTSAKKGPISKGLLSPVSTILKKLCQSGFCDPSLHFAVRSNSLPLIFKFSLDSFGKGGENKLVCFHLLARFTAALDLTEALTVKGTFEPGNWGLALLTLENLLSSSLSADIYNVAADRIQHGEVQFSFYRKVAQLLFSNVQPSIPAWYRCLKTLLLLNHLIVEPDLDELVCSAWIDADYMGQRVVKAREALITAIFQTYEKLRQFPRLLQEILEVICRPAADELRLPVLTAALQKSLSQSILITPHSQSLEMCSLILDKAQSCLLMDLEGQEDLALKLFSLSVLLNSVLFSVKTLDNSTPLPVVKRAQSLMEEMVKVIKSLLQQLQGSKPGPLWFEKVLETTLLLSYTLVEVDTLFKIHCSRYVSVIEEDCSGLLEENVYLLPCVAVSQWEQVACQSQPRGSTCRLLQELLALQRMKLILLNTDPSSALEGQNILCRISQFIVRTETSTSALLGSEVWDGQISSVDTIKYPTAHWFHVTSNLALIGPYLTEDDLSYIADILVNSLLQTDVLDGTTENTCLSVPLISKQLLGNMVLLELSPLYSFVVKRFLKSTTGIFSLSPESTECTALSVFMEAAHTGANGDREPRISKLHDDSTDDSLQWKRLERLAHEILSLIRAGVSITLSRTQTEELLHLLKACRVLKPDAVTPEDHSEYFLLLFFIVTVTQCDSAVGHDKVIELLKEVFYLMASWESGRNTGSVLKVMFGNVLLESIVTSLFSHGKKCVSNVLDHSPWLAFLEVVQNFLGCLIQTIIHRKTSVRLNLEKFTSFILESEVVVQASLSACDSQDPKCLLPLQLLLATFSTLCQTISSNLGRNKQTDETLLPLLEKVVVSMGSAVQASLRQETCSVLGQSFTVEVVRVMLQAELARVASLAPGGQEDHPSVVFHHMDFCRGFAQQILRELSSSPRPLSFLTSSLLFLTAYHLAAQSSKGPGLENYSMQVVQNLRNLLSAPWLSALDMKELEPATGDLLAQLATGSSIEQFQQLLALVGGDLSTRWIAAGRHMEVRWAVTAAKLLASCELPESHRRAFWFTVPQMMSAMEFVVKESCRQRALTDILTVPTVEGLTVLLRRGEGLLRNPHHVSLALGALHFVPLEHPSPRVRYSAFLAVHEALFAIIQCHPQAMLKAAPSFLNCFYRLVASVMKEGRQKGEEERGSEEEMEVLLKCARLVERMYTHIAAAAEGFTVLSSFVVAQYVCELQKVTLHPAVKSHLTEGIYWILDLCPEQDVKFLNATLQAGVRDVFGELYDNYTRYHKPQWHGDKKYTA
ncbi:unhealthy ribosome biogenesis protein 2 homolog [Paramormyrops kingsleyae]|uniref:unhealthy ribosome biogenesis protein 2 homolog n=1 Tax=Paramormyrops kingsleyae TaxID=1676925 RepID=UPI003B97BA63